MSFRILSRGLLAALAMTASLQAQAIAIVETPITIEKTYTWQGNCVDCAAAAGQGITTYQVSGLLVLRNYSEGSSLSLSNLVRFEYSGSNLIDPYIVTGPGYSGGPVQGMNQYGAWALSGTVFSAVGAYSVNLLFGDGLGFNTSSNGSWFTCAGQGENYASCTAFYNDDTGVASIYNALDPKTEVPLPATLPLLMLGLAAVGLSRRRIG